MLLVKKPLLIISLISVGYCQSNAQQHLVHGHVLDINLENETGARITNLKTAKEAYTNANGHYQIDAAIGDTLSFSFVGSTTEKRVVIDSIKHINVLLMNKTVNDLGALWTKKQYEKHNREVNRHYEMLIKQAKKQKKWD